MPARRTPTTTRERTTTTRNRTNNRRATRPSAGDYTGQVMAKAQRDRDQEEQHQAAEDLLLEDEAQEDTEHTIYDPSTQEAIGGDSTVMLIDDDEDEDEEMGPFERGTASFRHLDDALDDEEDDEPEPPRRAPRIGRFPGRQDNRERLFTGKETPEEMAPVLAERPNRAAGRPSVMRNPLSVIRTNADIEDMTFGMVPGTQRPNNFTLYEGRMYELPTEVCLHLDDKGLVAQWVRT